MNRSAESLLRLAMVKALSGILPLYVVTEYPKSGGTWVSQMLAACLDVPFPRNEPPELKTSVIHGHYRFSRGMKNVFVVLRDGRDAMVSFYHHCLFEMEGYDNPLVPWCRERLKFRDYEDVRTNLPAFIALTFQYNRYFRCSWTKFVDSWLGRGDAAFLRYEDLLVDPEKEMAVAIEKICGKKPDEEKLKKAVSDYSFEKQSGRSRGSEDRASFLRKGVAGDWKNYFSGESRRLFHRLGGATLIRAGYEQDDRWVEEE